MSRIAPLSIRSLFIVLSCLVAASRAAPAQESAPSEASAQQTVDSESIKAWMQAAESAEGLAEAVKSALKASYQKALADAQKAEESRRRAESFRQRIASAPQDTEAAQAELDALTSAPSLTTGLEPNARIESIEQALARAETTASQLEAEQASIENEGKAREARRSQASALKDAEQAKLSEARSKLEGAAPNVDPLDPAFATWVQWTAAQRAAEAEIESLDAELPSYDARARLLRIRIDLAHLKVTRQTDLVSRLRATLQETRAREARAEEERAQAEAQSTREHPVLAEIAKGTLEIVKLRTDPNGLVARIERSTKRSAELKQSLETSKDRFDQAQRYIEVVGLSDEVVRVLRQPTETKSALRDHQRAIADRERGLAELGLLRLEMEEARREFRDPLGMARAKFEELASDTDESGLADLKLQGLDRKLEELLVARRDAIDQTIDEIGRLTRIDLDLNEAERRLVDLTEQYTEYVDARVIWLRNADALGIDDIPEALQRAASLPSEEHPVKNTMAILHDAAVHWPMWGGAGLVCLVILHYRRKARAAFREADLDRVGFTNAAKPIFFGCLEALLATLPITLAFEFIASRCVAISAENDPARAMAVSLRAGMAYTTALYLLMRLMGKDGVFQRHMGWIPESLSRLRHLTRGYITIVVPLFCSYYYFVGRPTLEPSEPLGRLFFISAMIATAAYGFLIANPISKALDVKYRGDTSAIRRRRVLVILLVAYGPIVIAGLSAWGYHTTAHRLVERLFPTTVAVAAILIAVQLFDSWFYIARRAEALQRLRKRREEMQQEAAKSGAEKPSTDPASGDVPVLEVNEVDLKKLNAQASELVRGTAAVFFFVVMFWIWKDILPALRVLDLVTLWEVKTTTGGVETVRGVAIVDLLGAFVAMLLTWMVARNLPGLMEAAILSKLPFDAGARYAVVTILRYVITLIGVVVVFEKLGVGWEDFQWLVAAISVGLGFGLQEIFGNFVSGIILLFERPLRVGDVVTVSGVTGVVTKIRMRATTILDGDNKEHIIPNKNMITGAVVNWVLSSSTVRVQFAVGVAYGTDSRKVEQLLLSIGKSHSEVVDDPAPSVIFTGFGPSSLDFQLNVYVKSPAVGGRVRTEVNRAIDEAFQRQGIEIPFPTQVTIQREG